MDARRAEAARPAEQSARLETPGLIAFRSPGPAPLAAPSLHAVRAMSDGTGIFRRAVGIVPDRSQGYSLDDNARALMLVCGIPGLDPFDRQQLAVRYASFVQDAWQPAKGAFRTLMRFDRSWSEEQAEESGGRAAWALGRAAETSPDPDLRRWAADLLSRVMPLVARTENPRAVAFSMLGAAAMVRSRPDDKPANRALHHGAELLQHLLDRERRPAWAWFEAVLGCDNPRMPQALIEAGEALGRQEWIATGLETLEWIADRQTADDGHFRPIGSDSAERPYSQQPFDQQPLEAHAAIDASLGAHRVTGDRRWTAHAHSAWAWFFGRNDRGAVLADTATGRCRDGLTPGGANPNCGAESILAFQLASCSMLALAPHGVGDSGKRAEVQSQVGARPLA